jgi:prepilin-type N-terminal cleavage/methylation domain-containing protein
MRRVLATTTSLAGTSRVRGFSLVEVIIAMSLLTIVLMLLSTLALSSGRRARLNDLTTKRNFALAQQAGRIEVMPFADVTLLTSGTLQMLVGDFTFNRRLVVTPTGSTRYSIRIVVEPIAGEFRADSVTIDRTRPASGSPLCTTC